MTVTLDEFREATTDSHAVCSECGAEGGCLALWTEHETDQPADILLCLRCLFDSEGRYKHQPPEYLLREFETIKTVEERDDAVIITAESDLGRVKYLHHVDTSVSVVHTEADHRVQVVQFRKGRTLTGEVEAFTASGEYLADVSPYVDLAREHISE